jgi:monofunctional biosynthetic peptidoglycan transglycosylase
VLDGVMGGRSSGDFEIADGTLRFRGELNTDGGGFASLRTRPQELGLGNCEGVRVRCRGDGRTYTMRLQQNGDPRARDVSYRADFATKAGGEWQEVWLPFDRFVPMWRGRRLDLPPIDPNRIESVGLMIADKVDGPFRIELDQIAAFRPFDLDSLHWQRRPLVLFAPRLDDERLVAQLEELHATEHDFIDRDMARIVVVEQGDSHADGRPLSAATVAALRERFGVESGTFALHLVGKDGGVKRSASAPVPMAELYAQIDAMPMRRAERERRPEPRDGKD